MDSYTAQQVDGARSLSVLPRHARLPINRANLPAVILGGLSFQRHPAPLHIDGVAELHAALFRHLEPIAQAGERARIFTRYMAAHFRLEHPEEAGLEDGPGRGGRRPRVRADYLRLLRGWLFNADGREAAVLKGWVESRFGLLARWHQGFLGEPGSEAYRRYEQERAQGLYATNALEAQLDLLYAYTQYELARRLPGRAHLRLYRGVNALAGCELMTVGGEAREVVLLNNLNAFSGTRERADEFGDSILETRVPLAKILFFSGLLPGMFQGEDEYLVIGGLYEVMVTTRGGG